MNVKIGLEVLLDNPALSAKWGQCGILLNQASVDAEIRPAQILLKTLLGERLKVLFTPQHGLCADKQDNMIESGHGRDFISGLPFYSLYSEVREPTDAMLQDIDTVIIDIQDVGTRVYTFIYTMAGIMRACARFGKRVVVLDRPNPIGGTDVEGNVMDDASKSFIGEYRLPMRHGLTIAEAARWINEFEKIENSVLFRPVPLAESRNRGIGVNLEVVSMVGWKRSMHYADTGRPWVMTSPNMPTAETAELYPGMVLLEGTNMSEGRGTTMPFLVIGAPYLYPLHDWLDRVRSLCDLSGLALRPTVFEPTFQKWAKETCWGVNFIPRDVRKIRSYQVGLAVIIASAAMAPDKFRYKDPPYEYVWDRLPMQLLLGSETLPQRLLDIAKGELRPSVLRDLEEEWQPALREFLRQRDEVLLYRDT
jgi:uncharacterized protein YbbC (DUF1343 family)